MLAILAGKRLRGLTVIVSRIKSFLAPTRIWDWWEFKAPVFLGVAYLCAYVTPLPFDLLISRLIVVVAALVPLASYVCVINEITDREVDRLAGKSNAMQGRSTAYQVGWVLACLAGGAASVVMLGRSEMALWCYGANWLAFTLYSVPPVRLKIRGLLGVVADACGGQFLPTLWTAAFISQGAGQPLPAVVIAMLAVWSFCLGLRGILGHQLRDLGADRSSGVETFVVQAGQERTLALLRWLIIPLELLAIGLTLHLAGIGLSLLALAIIIGVACIQRYRPLGEREINPVSFLMTYYLSLFPLVGVIQLGLREPLAMVILPFQLTLFPGCWGIKYSTFWRVLTRATVH